MLRYHLAIPTLLVGDKVFAYCYTSVLLPPLTDHWTGGLCRIMML